MSTSELERHNHPGCFGVPSVFSFTSPVCTGCASSQACRAASYQALLSMADSPFVGRFIAEHEAHNRQSSCQVEAPAHRPDVTINAPVPRVKGEFVPTEDQMRALESLPKKAAAYMLRLLKKGYADRIKEAARLGVNPFRNAPAKGAYVAYELLMQGRVSKSGLRAAFQERLGWTEGAAFSEVSMIWRVFCAMDIAQEEGEVLRVHPMLGAQNAHVINPFDKA